MNVHDFKEAKERKMQERQAYYQAIFDFLKAEDVGEKVDAKTSDDITKEVFDPKLANYRNDPSRLNIPKDSLDFVAANVEDAKKPWFEKDKEKVDSLLAIAARLNDFGIKSRVRVNSNTTFDPNTMEKPAGIERLVIDTKQDDFAANIERLKIHTQIAGSRAVDLGTPQTPSKEPGKG